MKSLTRSLSFLLITPIALSAPLFAKDTGYEAISDKNPLKIHSPSLKNRKTKKIRLTNGLEAYIISDPEAKQCAAALSTEVGSFYDPPEYPGMAHYVEHSLFMGTKKYPNENGFFEIVFDNQGLVNAYTKSDLTVYMFSCNPSAFSEILDRFGHFFIDPLFRKDALARELNSVDNEHQKNVKNDDWRYWQVCKETSNPSHPISKFSTGTKETLQIIPHKTLVSWYRRNYSADRMHLVVCGCQDMDTLTKLVIETFSEVPVSKDGDSLPYNKMASSEQEGHITYITPIKDLRRMFITWELPKQTALDRETKPADLIGYLLVNQSDNSLIEQLRREGLANSISYDVDNLSKKQSFLSFCISLTKKGVLHSDLVLERFYQALNQLKKSSFPSHIYEEITKTCQTEYQWQARSNPFYVVQQHADQMAYEPLETYPYQTTTISSFQPMRIQKLLQEMTAAKSYVAIQAPTSLTGHKTDRMEKWMGVEYTITKIDSDQLQTLEEAPPHAAIEMPFPNPFIASNPSLIRSTLTPAPAQPKLLAKEPEGICYFAQDTYYQSPEASIQIDIRSPAIAASPQGKVLTDLYSFCLKKSLAPLTSVGSRAGISSQFSANNLRLTIQIAGYSEKLDTYTRNLINRMQKNRLGESSFAQAKEVLESYYINQDRELPFFQGIQKTKSLLYNDTFSPEELSKALQQIDFESFEQFGKMIQEESFLEVTIGGNLMESDAKRLWQLTKHSLTREAINSEVLPNRSIIKLNQAFGAPFVINYQTPINGNAVVLTLQAGEESYEKLAHSAILGSVLQEAFFTELRTKQQIAYIAKASVQPVLNEVLIVLSLHSATHTTGEILARFDLFLENYVKNLKTEVPEERFAAIKQSLIYTYQKPQENLFSYLDYTHNLAFEHSGDFKRREKVIQALEELSYDSFISQTQTSLSRANTKRIAVTVSGPFASGHAFQYRSIKPEDFTLQIKNALQCNHCGEK